MEEAGSQGGRVSCKQCGIRNRATGRNKKPGAGLCYLLTRAREYSGEGIALSPLEGMESAAAGKKKPACGRTKREFFK
jgi:hypothetical protein